MLSAAYLGQPLYLGDPQPPDTIQVPSSRIHNVLVLWGYPPPTKDTDAFTDDLYGPVTDYAYQHLALGQGLDPTIVPVSDAKQGPWGVSEDVYVNPQTLEQLEEGPDKAVPPKPPAKAPQAESWGILPWFLGAAVLAGGGAYLYSKRKRRKR
jgi:hypothetical protein